MEVVLLEEARLPHCTLDERLRSGLPVLLEQARLERTGVDADTDADSRRLGRCGDLADLVVELADVAGVHAHRADARVDGGEDVLGLEVDVRDDRQLALGRDDVQHVGVVLVRDGNAHDVAAGRGEFGDLLERRVDIGGLRRRHRLHADLRFTSHTDLPDVDLAGLATGGEGFGCGRHPEVDGSHTKILRGRAASPAEAERALGMLYCSWIGLTMSA